MAQFFCSTEGLILHSFFTTYLLFQSSTLIHFDSPSLQAIPELIFCKILPAKDCIRSLCLAIRWVAFKRRLPAMAMPAMPLVSWWAVPLRCDRFPYPNDLRIYPFQRIWKNPQIIPNGYLKLRKSENPANFFKNLLGIPVFFSNFQSILNASSGMVCPLTVLPWIDQIMVDSLIKEKHVKLKWFIKSNFDKKDLQKPYTYNM